MKRAYNERWDIIAKVLSCANCGEVVKTAFFYCAKGHLYCNLCSKTATASRCCVCRGPNPPKINERNLLIEEVRSTLKFPCHWEGCSYVSTILDVVEHEAMCMHRHILCLLCKEVKVFPKKDLENHVLSIHKNRGILRKAKEVCFPIPKVSEDEVHKTVYLSGTLIAVQVSYDNEHSVANISLQIIKDGTHTIELNGSRIILAGWNTRRVKSLDLKTTTKVDLMLS